MTIAASDTSPDALMLLVDPDALAVVVSALFGGDPDLPAGADRAAIFRRPRSSSPA